jgi:hypothetical protein
MFTLIFQSKFPYLPRATFWTRESEPGGVNRAINQKISPFRPPQPWWRIDGSAAAAVQSSAPLPPRIKANTPPGHDVAISPSASLRTRPSACLFPTARFRRETGWSTSHSCFGCLPPKLQTRRHSSPRLILIVSSRDEEGKVRNC